MPPLHILQNYHMENNTHTHTLHALMLFFTGTWTPELPKVLKFYKLELVRESFIF